MVRLIKISDWATKNVITLNKEDTIHKAIMLMDKHDIGVIPVVEENVPVGIITERDILRRVVVKEIDAKHTPVAKVMTKNPICIDADTSLLEVARLMSKNNFRRLLVIKDKKLAGIITEKDVIRMMSA
ncbi:MAG: CBS domain-containing protein [archaeon]